MNQMLRSTTHWTAGGGRANAVDREHYHRITEYDGTVINGKEAIEDNLVTSDGDYAAHTLRLNTGSAGFAMAGMIGAIEHPFDAGTSPITEKQFEAHCAMLADFHISYGIPVTRETCLTHAEVEPTLGVKQRGKWDLTRLPFKPGLRGAIPVGDYMRSRVKAYMGVAAPQPRQDNRPTLRRGDRGAFVLDLQVLLKSAGCFSGKQDGDFGRLTEAAVREFQAENDLTADGIVGANTWAALMRPKPMPKREVTTADLRERGSRTVKAADHGQSVVTFAGAAGAIGVGADALSTASGALGQAESALDRAQGVVLQFWPILLIAALCAALWYYFREIKAARVDDAVSGRNRGR